MPAGLRALICMLLFAAPSWAAEPAKTDIVAEFVGCEFGQGFTDCRFISADNTEYSIMFCSNDDPQSYCVEWRTAEYKDKFKDLDERRNLGKQFIITPKKSEIERNLYWDEKYISIQAKSISLDKRKNAPRNTKIFPYQKISGKIQCSRDDGLLVHLTTKDGIRYRLSPHTGDAYRKFYTLCKIKRITLEGELLLWPEEKNLFKIYCNDISGDAPCFKADR